MLKHMTYLLLLASLFLTQQLIAKDNITAAINHSDRPAADTKIDDNRKPDQVLKLSEVEEGDKVLDFFAGGGYYTELIARVVGEKGQVTSHNNKAYLQYVGDQVKVRFADNRLSNATHVVAETDELTLEENSYDAIFLMMTFHDFYLNSPNWQAINVDALLPRLNRALKSDGVLMLTDHIGPDADIADNSNRLHRIFPAHVKEAFAKAGFTLDTEADFLLNADDPLTISVFDPSIRGKTSRLVFKFRK